MTKLIFNDLLDDVFPERIIMPTRTPQDAINEAKVLEDRVKQLRVEADRLARQPQDHFPNGAVITFTKLGRPRAGAPLTDLSYAAIKADDHWFLTGVERFRKTWDELLAFIGEPNFHTVRYNPGHGAKPPQFARPARPIRRSSYSRYGTSPF